MKLSKIVTVALAASCAFQLATSNAVAVVHINNLADDPVALAQSVMMESARSKIPYAKEVHAVAGQMVMGDYAKVIELATKVLETTDAPQILYLLRAKAYDLQNQNSEALQDYDKYLAGHPMDLITLSSRSLVLARTGECEKALADIDKCLSVYINVPFLLARRADLYIALKRYDDALADLQRAELLEPCDSARANAMALAFQMKGDLKKSLEYYTFSVMLDPKNERAFANRALCYEDLDKHEFAREDLKRAVEINPSFDFAWASLAEVNFVLGKYDECIGSANTAIKINPNNAFAYAQIGCANGNKGDDEAALKAFQKAIELDPSKDTYYLNVGVYLMRAKKYQEAAEQFTKSIDIKNTLDAREHRARCYVHLGQLDKAQADYEAALSMKPKDGHFLGLKAITDSTVRDDSGATEEAKAALNSLASCHYLYTSLIENDQNKLLPTKARLDFLNRAIALPEGNDDPRLFLMRGRIYAKLHKKRLKLEDFQTAAKLGLQPDRNGFVTASPSTP